VGPARATSTPSTDVRQIGHWRVDKQIGRGSFAVVWRARHADTGQRVAVKEIRLDKLNRKLRESLESEIQVLQRSRHGNIIKLHDIIK
jgi:serine/threonine-protein kinase ULK/ATG1